MSGLSQITNAPPGAMEPARIGVRSAVGSAAAPAQIQQLKELEKDGIVTRTLYPKVPPQVDYALSDMGLALGPSIEALIDWTFMRREQAALTSASRTLLATAR